MSSMLLALWATTVVAKPRSALPATELFKRCSPSVVLVVAIEDEEHASQGSGVALTPEQIVTNWHVVEGRPLIGVKSGAQILPAILFAEDSERDLAVLRVLNAKLSPAKVSSGDVEVGERVYAIGAPKGLELTLSEGLVSSRRELPRRTLVQTTAAISHGSSGGGLFNERGELVGITTLQLQDARGRVLLHAPSRSPD